jgi:hypothetical protein
MRIPRDTENTAVTEIAFGRVATLAGDIERCSEGDAALSRALAQAQERHTRLANSPEILAEKKIHLAAMDTAIRVASDDRASPTCAGTVRAFALEYTKRGWWNSGDHLVVTLRLR